MDADAGEGLRAAQVGIAAAEGADQILDAGVDVGAVEGGDAGVGEGDHVRDGVARVDRAVAAGHLPAAADDAGDFVVGREGDALHLTPPAAARQWSPRG